MVRSSFYAVCVLLIAAVNVGGDASVSIDRVESSKVRINPQDLKAGSTSKSGGQLFQFQAEVNRLMDIIINSLYSNKDIFLRELISNASDALDKIRYLALTNPKLLGDGDQAKLEVKVRADKEANTLEIIDTGIGMTREDLIKNLGTIAKSGTKSFLEKATEAAKEGKADSSNLIGQFGVGFYSAYLVADRVTVTSKHNDDKQHVWESGAEQTFSVYEDTDGEQLGRGTKITLHLKDDSKDYLEESKITELVKKYSQFINFPIYLQKAVEVDVKEDNEKLKEKGEDEAETESEKINKKLEKTDNTGEEKSTEDEIKVEDGDAKDKAEEKKEKTKKVMQYTWSLVNENKPIWTRNPKDVSEEDYQSFYDGISRLPGSPMARAHFRGEGEVEFQSILFIPDKPPVGLYGNDVQYEKNAIKLYVRKVLVSDKFEYGLLPRYLAFLVGIVDSNDVPINVSREMLQQSKTLDIIRRKLIRKALEMIRSLMKQDDDSDKDKSDGKQDGDSETEDNEDKESSESKNTSRYVKFWTKFGKSLKLGIIEDSANRQRLAKLLRFRTSKTNLDDPNDWASLDDYLDRMKKDQDHIYYLSGEDLDSIKKSPFLEKLLKKGYEVIYLSEAIDEHMIMQLPDFEGSKFMSVSKDNFKFGDKDQKEEKEKMSSLKKKFRPLTKYLKTALGDKVSKVKLSTRLSNTPCVLSTEQYGYSARMEIIMKAQAFADPDSFAYMTPKAKIMELNPHHPLIKEMLARIAKDGDDSDRQVAELGHLVYDTALVSSGYLMRENDDFAKRMYKLLSSSVGVDPNAPVVEEFPEDTFNEQSTSSRDATKSKEGFKSKSIPEDVEAHDEL